MVANLDLVLLHGPPFSGRDVYITKQLTPTHERICPKELFERDSNVGLRDVILKVVLLLKQGKKIVVDDENATLSTRQSYLKVVDKKVPRRISKALVTIRPKFGCQQIYWCREFYIVDQIELDNVEKRPLVETEINKWFQDVNSVDIKYQTGIDEPDESEGFHVYDEILPLCTFSSCKFEIPALFLQWDGIILQKNDNVTLQKSVISICQQWAEVNPWGRIIVICDGSSVETSETSHIKSIIKQLVLEFQTSPVYAIQIISFTDAGSFVIPPKPGLLAYLQKRHCLDLQSKSTLYLYHNQNHMKMAEVAGVQYMKISKCLQNPHLVLSSHIATKPAIPQYIRQIEIYPITEKSHIPTIPLYGEKSAFSNFHICKSPAFGRCEYIFAKDIEVLERYQSVYSQYASLTSSPASKIQDLIHSRTPVTQNKSCTQIKSTNKQKLTRSDSDSRDLPKWMIGQKESYSSKPALSSKSDSTSSNEGIIRQTVYVMTEKELAEIATDILKQAGREDILKEIKSAHQTRKKQSDITNSVVSTNKIKGRSPPCGENFEPVPGTSKQNVYVPNTVIGQTDTKKLSDITEAVIGDSDMCECDNANDSDEKATNVLSQNSKSKTAVLDDFMNENYERKRSPRKKQKGERSVIMVQSSDDKDPFSDTEMSLSEDDKNISLCDHDHDKLPWKKSPLKKSPVKTVVFPNTDVPKTDQKNSYIYESELSEKQEFTDNKKKEKGSSDTNSRPTKRKGPDLSILDEIFN